MTQQTFNKDNVFLTQLGMMSVMDMSYELGEKVNYYILYRTQFVYCCAGANCEFCDNSISFRVASSCKIVCVIRLSVSMRNSAMLIVSVTSN